jgi:NAD(P)-dependent dehydrogenase (short-subunit alcohol dehydrogenase family)
MFKLQLSTKTAIVTGGAAGIGYDIVKWLAEAGAAVVIADLSDSGAEKAKVLCDAGHRVLYIKTDVTKEADIEQMLGEAATTYGGIDILVNNAGIYPRANLLETSEALWNSVIDVNLKSMFLCCKLVIPYMRQKAKGAIINLGSSHAFAGMPELFAYSVSKGGVATLTRNLAGAYARDRIRVNCVNPGWVASEREIIEQLASGQTIEWMMDMGKSLPLGRLQTGDDTAALVLFLVSELADQITGQVINVDGGIEVG